MSNTFVQLETLIKKHDNALERDLLLATYTKKNFNLLFRQAAGNPATLNIVEFLYTHQAEFVLDVNASGASNKSALEIAIEFGCAKTVIYLLELQEVTLKSDGVKKIQEKFGNDFIRNFGYKSLNSIIEFKKAVDAIQQSASEIDSQLKTATKIITSATDLLMANLREANAVINFLSEIYKGMEYYEAVLKPFEELSLKHNKYLSCFYTLQKFTPEYQDDGMSSDILLKCDEYKNSILSGLEECANITQSTLKTYFKETDNPSFFKERAIVEMLLKNTEKSPQDPDLQLTPKSALKQPLKCLDAKKTKEFTKSNTEQNAENLQVLYFLLDEIKQLRQKGQVKQPDFINLIQKINKEISLVLKKTKSGGLVEYKTNSFSFHNPHKKEGVDKNALRSLQHLVENEIDFKKPSL